MNEPSPSTAPTGQPQRRAPADRPWVTYGLLGVTILVFIGQYLSESSLGMDLVALLGEKINQAILAGEYWRLVTPVFLHGSIYHIGFNMYALFMIGPTMERFYGHLRFALLYFLSAIAGNVVSYYLSPEPSLGASTAIFGLVAAEAVFVFRNREFFGSQARSMLTNTLLIVGINLAWGMTSSGIDNWGHLGGLGGGLAFAWTAGPLLAVTWNPGGGYSVFDRSSRREAWLAGAVELAVLVALVLVRGLKA